MGYERKKILIADDNKSFLMYMALLLRRMGFDVILAENGVEALKLIKRMQPDLVLLDCNMPKLDGISVLRYLYSDSEIAPVSIVTISSDPKTFGASGKFEGCGSLQKPIQIEALHEVLQNCIFRPMGFTRKHLRIPFNERVSVTYGDDTQELFAESLSEGGMYIRKKEPFPVTTGLKVSIPLHGAASLTFIGSVIYVKGLYADLFRVPPGMAVEFRDVLPDDAAALKSYIKEYLAKDIWEDQEETFIGKTS